ncbi:MAG: NAD(P)H-binding protein [Phycisphaeraceae bacterium]|nr:NAD(P)H-binding protein [Phycisphaeraceae bacterium]
MGLPEHSVRQSAAVARRVLVAGAGGVLGRHVVRQLIARGERVLALVRRSRSAAAVQALGAECRVLDALAPEALRGIGDGVDAIVSCLGAPVTPSPFVGRRPYTRVDAPANISLADEAVRAGVSNFTYVALAGGRACRTLNYADAHERVVDHLEKLPIAACIVRPTGFFAAMAELVSMARWGVLPIFGDGAALTNPVHEADVAAVIVQSLDRAESSMIEVGGPDTFSRKAIGKLAFEAIGRRARFVHVPPKLARCGAMMLAAINPRAGHFVRFATHVMTTPCIAPCVGSQRLADYFHEYARKG